MGRHLGEESNGVVGAYAVRSLEQGRLGQSAWAGLAGMGAREGSRVRGRDYATAGAGMSISKVLGWIGLSGRARNRYGLSFTQGVGLACQVFPGGGAAWQVGADRRGAGAGLSDCDEWGWQVGTGKAGLGSACQGSYRGGKGRHVVSSAPGCTRVGQSFDTGSERQVG
jgi:hypothetical protein